MELYGKFEFDIAGDGCIAIEKLAGELPDLVLLDLYLPGVDGFTVLDVIRQRDSCLPVVVISAYGDIRTRQEAARRGANDFFVKPFSHQRLYRRMRELMATAPGHYERHSDEAERLAKMRRLGKLKERQAMLGISAPPELLIEIEDLEGELGEAQ